MQYEEKYMTKTIYITGEKTPNDTVVDLSKKNENSNKKYLLFFS